VTHQGNNGAIIKEEEMGLREAAGKDSRVQEAVDQVVCEFMNGGCKPFGSRSGHVTPVLSALLIRLAEVEAIEDHSVRWKPTEWHEELRNGRDLPRA
jgi:hypothetical protein